MTNTFVYLIEAVGTGFYKIGVTVDLKARINGLQTSCPFRLRLVCACKATGIQLEREFHKKFEQYREIGEWFALPKEVVKYATVLMSLPHEDEVGERESVIQSLNLCLPSEGSTTLSLNQKEEAIVVNEGSQDGGLSMKNVEKPVYAHLFECEDGEISGWKTTEQDRRRRAIGMILEIMPPDHATPSALSTLRHLDLSGRIDLLTIIW
jgi:hypothetical protein